MFTETSRITDKVDQNDMSASTLYGLFSHPPLVGYIKELMNKAGVLSFETLSESFSSTFILPALFHPKHFQHPLPPSFSYQAAVPMPSVYSFALAILAISWIHMATF